MHRVTLRIDFAPEWEEKTLKDVCSLISRGSAPTYMEESTVFAIGQRCVRETGFQASEARPHDSRRLSGQLRPRHGDVLLNSTGTGTIGRSCVFDANGDFIVDGHITVLRPRSTHLDGRWLNAVLQLPEGQVHLETQCYSGSTNQVELSRARLESTALHLPHIPEQRRIAEIFDMVDGAIRTTERLIEKLKAIKAGLLHDLFTRGIDENGRIRDPIAHPEQFRGSILGSLPCRWEAVHLGTEATVNSESLGLGTPLSARFRYIDISSVQRGRIDWSSVMGMRLREAPSRARRVVRPGDVLLCTVRPALKSHAFADWEDQTGYVASTGFAVLRCGERLQPRYLFHFLFSDLISGQLRRLEVGSNYPAVNESDVWKLLIPLPEIEEQARIACVLGRLGARTEAEGKELVKLRLLKQGLMHDLLTGKVRVPIDEEAEA